MKKEKKRKRKRMCLKQAPLERLEMFFNHFNSDIFLSLPKDDSIIKTSEYYNRTSVAKPEFPA